MLDGEKREEKKGIKGFLSRKIRREKTALPHELEINL